MWSKAKNGLVQPRKQGRTSPLIILRKRENLREDKRKSDGVEKINTTSDFGLTPLVISELFRSENRTVLASRL